MFIHRKKLLVIETAIDTCTMFDIPFKLYYAIIDFDFFDQKSSHAKIESRKKRSRKRKIRETTKMEMEKNE